MGLLETQSLPGIQYPTMPLRLDIDCNNVYQNATQCHLCWEGCEGVHPCLYQCLLIGWPSSNNINSSLLHPLKRLRHGPVTGSGPNVKPLKYDLAPYWLS